MPSTTVQFREDPEVIQFLREEGVNPNELARDAFQAAVRKVRAEARSKRIRELRPRVQISSEEMTAMIRKDRDTNHGHA